MMMVLLSTFLIVFYANASEVKNADLILEAKPQDETIDFSSIRDLIKKDGLESELKKKEEEKKLKSELLKKRDKERFSIPPSDQFYPFFFEYWLVKNAPKLKWDFHKPDYGIEESYSEFLKNQGYIETKFKILFTDSTEVFRLSFLGKNDEVVHVISLPFIRTLDLSKIEISLLLFEDFVRAKRGYLVTKLNPKDLSAVLGTNYSGKEFPKKIFDKLFLESNEIIFKKGFTFQEQFELTKEIDQQLKADLKMWNTYYTLLSKIDQLTKNNALYKKYAQLYPSPEMQMNWLKPQSKFP